MGKVPGGKPDHDDETLGTASGTLELNPRSAVHLAGDPQPCSHLSCPPGTSHHVGSHPGHASRQPSRDCERREAHSSTRRGGRERQKGAPQAKVNREVLKRSGSSLLPTAVPKAPPGPGSVSALGAGASSASATPDPRGRGPCHARCTQERGSPSSAAIF